MADYFTHFVTILEVGSEENAIAAMEIAKDFAAWHPDYDEGEPSSIEFLDAGFVLRVHSENPAAIVIEDDAGEGNTNVLVCFVLHLAETFSLTGRWGFEYANTCSKPHLDGFGGGAVVLNLETREPAQWMASNEWLTINLGESTTTTGWLVQLNHKHGSDVSIRRTKEDATETVAQFCRDWWAHEDLQKELCLTAAEYEEQHGREAMIDAYYEGNEDENAEITEIELPQ